MKSKLNKRKSETIKRVAPRWAPFCYVKIYFSDETIGKFISYHRCQLFRHNFHVAPAMLLFKLVDLREFGEYLKLILKKKSIIEK